MSTQSFKILQRLHNFFFLTTLCLVVASFALLLLNKGDTGVPADNGDISLKYEDVRDNETYIKDNNSKFGGN
jgi:hypothetical protein